MVSPLDDVAGIRARLRARRGELTSASVRDRVPLEAWASPVTGSSDAPLAPPPAAADASWVPLAVGEPWGSEHPLAVWGFPADGGSVTWLRTSFEVPTDWAGDDVLLALDDPRPEGGALGYEGLLHVDGGIVAGLDEFHRAVRLPDVALTGSHDVLVRCSLAGRRAFSGFELHRRDPAVWRLANVYGTLLDAADIWADGDLAQHQVVIALDETYRLLDLRTGWQSEEFRVSARLALEHLLRAVPSGGGPRPRVTAIGHAHLDVAWLWPIWRTRQKVVHTVATALHLMDRYPDFHFALSAPQTWAYVRDDEPDLYRRMKQRVAEGRLEPVGVMWLECDANLPSGEAMIRQVKQGLAFYAAETGQKPPAAWLPDSFGYSASLPTILAGFGVACFLTTKLSWNRVNRMPADTFRWRGVDGSEVLAHFVTASSEAPGHPADPHWHTYNGNMTVAEVAGLWANYRGKDANDELLYLFGHGDGGGGPTERMLETAALLADLPGLPQVRLGRSADFFGRLVERTQEEVLPTWSGDLYMEGHRGTFTSQARTKRGNRDGEKAAREAEWVNAWAVLESVADDRQSEIDRAWETVLRNQFHDILPGSSIAQVYAETAVEHARVRAELGRIRDAATLALTGPPTGEASAVVGSAAWPRTEVVARGDALLRVHAPAFGFAPLASAQSLAAADGAPPVSLVGTAEGCWRLDNGLIRVDVDVRGDICALTDLSTGRDFIAPDRAANALVLYEDRPLMWDAWDIDAFYADKPVALDALERVEGEVLGGGLRGEVVVRRRSGDTMVEQRLVLDAGARRLDIATDVDWRERNVLLRATFPCATGARHVTVGRPFGSVELPVHRNTSWEQARFEFAAHGWLDLSDGSGGIALLTDGTYGHSVEGSTIGLSLLKSGAWPDPSADEGVHRFRYALMPYAGTWQAAGVPRAAFELTYPLRLVDTVAPGSRSLLHVEGEAVIAETVKSADDGDGMVVRLVETHAASGVARLVLERPPASAHRCDLGEHPIEELTIHGREVVVPFGPHQVTTVRLRWDR